MKVKHLLFFILIGCALNSQGGEVINTPDSAKTDSTKKQIIKSDKKCAEVDPVSLVKTRLLNDKITLLLPEDFKLMSEEVMATKYPSTNRPGVVYTNEQGSINFAFNHTENEITERQFSEALPVLIHQFNSLYPQIDWFKKEITTCNDISFIVLEFMTPAIDNRIYNLMYITALNGKMLICSFNCMESQKLEWEAVAIESLNSIELR